MYSNRPALSNTFRKKNKFLCGRYCRPPLLMWAGEQDRSFSLCHLPPIKEQHSG
ncbi:hypothetical protein DESPIG_00834 [Desulfovibrio piger ATCC 29098]|uniref:Uncharacterized protein n=1 Tax=Desulfovibrio piger ATCC 29098 TaxID=411464 RepID=B6WRZ0_9BACT|nr:hypothetical protein DESPIG_00834 [Desulfovibrio piger ATCC 29098]